jgi:sugar phosphate isomerase/epimerase
MKVCTSINVFYDWDFIVPVEDQIQRVYDAGFRHMDMNFWDWALDPASPFRRDNWRDWVEGIAKKAQALNVKFTQAHADVFNFYTSDAERYQMYLRCLEGAAMLGVPWITFHPSGHPDFSPETEAQNLKDNIEYYKPLVEVAEKYRVGIALENMSSRLCKAEHLNQMVDALDSPFVGICWDTGHANLIKLNQAEVIRELGSRIIATHIHNNCGFHDDHALPTSGSIDFVPIMHALFEIGYDKALCLEARVPVEGIRLSFFRHAEDCLFWLLAMREM